MKGVKFVLEDHKRAHSKSTMWVQFRETVAVCGQQPSQKKSDRTCSVDEQHSLRLAPGGAKNVKLQKIGDVCQEVAQQVARWGVNATMWFQQTWTEVMPITPDVLLPLFQHFDTAYQASLPKTLERMNMPSSQISALLPSQKCGGGPCVASFNIVLAQKNLESLRRSPVSFSGFPFLLIVLLSGVLLLSWRLARNTFLRENPSKCEIREQLL
jgi:hypothetical protein